MFFEWSLVQVYSPAGLQLSCLNSCPHLVTGNQYPGQRIRWYCVHTLSTRCDCVHSYSILPCGHTPFWTCAYQRLQSSGLKTNKLNCVHTGTRFPLLCPKTRSNQHRVLILHGYLQKGYDHVISECPAAFTVLGTRCLRNYPGNCPHLVPENQYLGTGTKWCCVHRLSIWYVTAYIITRFHSSSRLSTGIVSEFSHGYLKKSFAVHITVPSEYSICSVFRHLAGQAPSVNFA